MGARKSVINVKRPILITVHAKGRPCFTPLQFIKMRVEQTAKAQCFEFFDNITVVPPTVPHIPFRIAVEIAQQQCRRMDQERFVALQELPELANVAKSG